MTLFHYKTVDSFGKTSDETLEAKDKETLLTSIKKEGITVISVEEKKSNKGVLSMLQSIPFLGSVSAHDKIMFARNLSHMIEAGLPITRGLSIMERQAKPGKFKQVLTGLGESITKGSSFSDSMKIYPDVFSTLFISMAKAGEESGNLASSLKNISGQMEKTYQLTKKVQGALMYPAVIIFLMVVIGVLMMVFMVPSMTATFVGLGIKLPLLTRIIIGISNFLTSYFGYVIIGSILSFLILFSALNTKKGQRLQDIVFIRIPVIGEMIKEVNSARTARTLSSLLSSGVDIVVAINITKEVIQNTYYKAILDQIQIAIQKGEQISSIFIANQGFYPLFVGEMVAVGEETGKIGDMLSNVAEFYENEVDQKTKDMSSVIEPFLMIFIGVAVGFFAMAIIGPMYSLADNIK